MSQPISIRRKHSDLFPSVSCPDFLKLDGLLIYSGLISRAVRVNSNFNSYKVLCSMVGPNPIAKNLLTSDNLAYTLYYDQESQKRHAIHDYNKIISQFTGTDYWGTVLIWDPNQHLPIIKSIEDILDISSI